MASRRDIAALAAAIYGEARGESRRGKEAVAHVAINRSEIGGVSLADVVYGSSHSKWGQFSFADPGDNNAKTVRDAPRKDPRAWAEAVEIAVDVVEGRANGTKADPTEGATHYHAQSVNPSWSRAYDRTATIGGHEFYRGPEREVRGVVQSAARSQHRRADHVDVAAVPADMVPSANRAAPETVAASAPEAGLLMALSGQAAPPSPEAGLLMDMPSQRAISDMVTPGRGLANLAPDGLRAPSSPPVDLLDLTRPIAYSNTANRNREPYAGLVTHHDRVRDLQQIADITNYPREDGHMKGYHFAIDRDGRIAQLAPLDQRVNHVGEVAGRGSAQTLTNRNSVAVVMLGADDKHSPAQEEALRSLAGNLREQGIELNPTNIGYHAKGRTPANPVEGQQAANMLAGSLAPIPAPRPSRTPPAVPGPVARSQTAPPGVAQSYRDFGSFMAQSEETSPPSIMGELLGVSPASAAPVASVSRSPLPDLPTQRIDAAFSAPQARPELGLDSYRSMASMPSYETVTPAELAPPPAPASVPQAPAPVDPASYAQMSSLPSYASLTAPAPPPSNIAVPQSIGPLATPAPQLAPAPAPVPAPALPPAMPPPQPVPAPPPAPVPTQSPTPAPAAPRAPSGFDVWGGKADFGIATGGYEMAALDNGNVARYSPQFDRTDIERRDGSFVRSVPGRIDGPVNDTGSINPFSMDNVNINPGPARTDMGRAVRGGLGGIAGGMAGGLLGPVGAMLGAALGREVAAGGLLSRGGFGPQWTAPSMGWASQQGAPAVDANGFPAAPPSPPGGGSNPTDFDMDHARSVSPDAADAVRSGKAGLF